MKNTLMYLIVLTKSQFLAAFSDRLCNQSRGLKKEKYFFSKFSTPPFHIMIESFIFSSSMCNLLTNPELFLLCTRKGYKSTEMLYCRWSSGRKLTHPKCCSSEFFFSQSFFLLTQFKICYGSKRAP